MNIYRKPSRLLLIIANSSSRFSVIGFLCSPLIRLEVNKPEKLKMELNHNGPVKATCVRHFQRVVLKRRETQSIKEKLINARNYGKVRLHQIAVVGDREFLRVKPDRFNGSVWIEVQ